MIVMSVYSEYIDGIRWIAFMQLVFKLIFSFIIFIVLIIGCRSGEINIDLTKIKPGEHTVVMFMGKPVWVVHRTPAMLEAIEKATLLVKDPRSLDQSRQPKFADNLYRSLSPHWFVVMGDCYDGKDVIAFLPVNHEYLEKKGWRQGFRCEANNSNYDLAGRVYLDSGDESNLKIPIYNIVGSTLTIVETGYE
jgi:ubiquinol-cytochrome c reductase iron-sulfur subunit